MLLYVYSKDRSLGQIQKPCVREEEYMKLHLNGPPSYHYSLLKAIDLFLSTLARS